MKLSTRLLFAIGATIAVVATIVYGIMISGSPSLQRMKRADDQRSSQLQQIKYSVDSYWNERKQLPQTLEAMRGASTVYMPPTLVDPTTGAPYEFRVTGDQNYELCAIFETDTAAPADPRAVKMSPGPEGQFYQHGVGRTCFPLSVYVMPTPIITR